MGGLSSADPIWRGPRRAGRGPWPLLPVGLLFVTERITWIGTSWKMTKLLDEARRWCQVVAASRIPEGVVPFVLPPHTALTTVRAALPADGPVLVGAQDGHWAREGGWTGEVSMAQVLDAGATLVEIGHSERRVGLHESDRVVALKVRAAVDAGLTPLLCVGEPASARVSGGHERFVTDQLTSALAELEPGERQRVVVAYEPIWSIGPSGTAATPPQIAPTVAALAARGLELSDGVGLRAVLYGGSVDASVASELLDVGHVDGLFVGRAAWSPEGFLEIVRVASEQLPERSTDAPDAASEGD
jgi:triosephosphate isomerase